MTFDELRNRRGSFFVDHHMIERFPDDMMKAMQNLIIVRCESRFDRGGFQYVVLSPELPLVEEMYETPEYELHITNGVRTFVPKSGELRHG